MTDIKKHFNSIAKDYDYYKKKNSYYYSQLKKILEDIIPPGRKVLEIGCGTGDLLCSVKPMDGLGIDISEEMVKIACQKYRNKSNLHFSTKKLSSFMNNKFEYVFMSDVIEHLEKPEYLLEEVSMILGKGSIFVITMANPIWEPVLLLAEKLKLKMPEGKHYRYGYRKIKKILNKYGLEVIDHDRVLLCPIYLPIVSGFINRYLERIFKKYAFIEYIISKKS